MKEIVAFLPANIIELARGKMYRDTIYNNWIFEGCRFFTILSQIKDTSRENTSRKSHTNNATPEPLIVRNGG